MIPTRAILLVCGIPASGKSTFGTFMARNHGFAHYDLECFPQGWPCPDQDLHDLWERSRQKFITEVGRRHARVVLDWGFPAAYRSWVDELRAGGAKVVWFDGDRQAAREAFITRDGTDVSQFDSQVAALNQVNLPGNLADIELEVLHSDGTHEQLTSIVKRIFKEKD
jgi:gluconate kinase